MNYGTMQEEVVGKADAERIIQAQSGNDDRQRIKFSRFMGISLGLALVWGGAGCHKTSAQASYGPGYQNAGDPADANMAGYSNQGYSPAQPAQVMGQNVRNESVQQAQDYQQQGAPIERRYSDAQNAYGQGNDQGYGDWSDSDAADIYQNDLTEEQASEAPPPLPDYEQPPAPDPDYLWTPGYWAWGPYGYYWVPGAWVEAPYVGALWTPGYWAYYDGGYRFHHGYWGQHVGFYGGINYGFGYFGFGYFGGYWNGPHFYYNRAVSRIDDRRIHYVYDRDERAQHVRFAGGVSFNGGRGGLQVRPRPAEIMVLREQRRAPLASQDQLRQQSAQNRQQSFSQNRGRPAVAVDSRPITSDHRMPAALPSVTRQGQRGFRQDGGQQQPQVQGQPRFGQQNGVTPQGRVVQGVPDAQQQNRRGYQQNGSQPQNQVQPQVQPQAQPQPGAAQPMYRRGRGNDQSQGQQQQSQGQQQNTPQAQPQQQAPPQQQQGQPNYRRGGNDQQRSAPQPAPQAVTPQAQPQAVPQQQAQPMYRRGYPQQQQAQPQQQQQAPSPQAQPQYRRAPEAQQARPQAPAPAPQPAPQPRQESRPQPQAQPQQQAAPPQDRGQGRSNRREDRGRPDR